MTGSLVIKRIYISSDNKLGKVVQFNSDLISNVYAFCKRAIIIGRNLSAWEINNILLKKIQGEVL